MLISATTYHLPRSEAAPSRSKGKATSSSRASVFRYGRGIESRLLVDDRPDPLRAESLTGSDLAVSRRSW